MENNNLTAIIGGVVGVASLVVSVASLMSGNPKMMKAPGKDGYIPRAAFEKNPAAYFRNLRS
ncbi:hypothetical protein E5676_scaffold475G00220 [Cucumis melo var. makuwa]|uniref:Uncharacterized protein n=2 Tax=Cucumis melo TaxID=3656 RepID=A0A5D3CFA6_CUCMM|nr:hypothetical protein E6C27_scaffold65G004940 [Cucumis melo var. makuwa]TYK09036.1 hypothetical protein E5676_scaffold475G00220 [Cucumis melo var. makuwa]